MDGFKRLIGTSILALARFLDAYFYHIAVAMVGLGAFNYFFVKNWDKELFNAAKEGKIKELKGALRNDGDVNAQLNGDCTALIMACGTKQAEAAEILINTGKCKLELIDSKGRTALIVACASGIVDIVKLLLKNKADVKAADNNGNTPLIVACFAGHVEVVRSLLAFGAEPRWKNKVGLNALGAAIETHKEEGGRLGVMKELLVFCFRKDIALTESRNATTGWTPLIKACYKGYADVARLLLDYNADLHARGKKGFTALIAASQNGWKDAVKLLLDRGADPLMALDDGSTALIAASFGGYHEIVEMLAECDPKCLTARFKNGSTPLMTAALNGFISVVEVLLALGVDVNHINDDKWSALSVAAQKGCYQICKRLLDQHAEVEVCTDKGFTPLMLAVKAGHISIARELLQHGALVNHFAFDAQDEALELKRMPLYFGYLTPLMLAINRGDAELVGLVLQHGPDLYLDLAHLMSQAAQSEDKYSLVELEDIKKQVRLAEEKEKEYKDSVNAGKSTGNRNVEKEVQAEIAQAQRRLEMFQEEQELQEQSLRDATVVYTYFSTPLLFAVYGNSLDIARLLLVHERERVTATPSKTITVHGVAEADAVTNITTSKPKSILEMRNAQDVSPLQLAVDYRFTEMVLLLMQHGAQFPLREDFGWRMLRFVVYLVWKWHFIALFRFLYLYVMNVVKGVNMPSTRVSKDKMD